MHSLFYDGNQNFVFKDVLTSCFNSFEDETKITVFWVKLLLWFARVDVAQPSCWSERAGCQCPQGKGSARFLTLPIRDVLCAVLRPPGGIPNGSPAVPIPHQSQVRKVLGTFLIIKIAQLQSLKCLNRWHGPVLLPTPGPALGGLRWGRLAAPFQSPHMHWLWCLRPDVTYTGRVKLGSVGEKNKSFIFYQGTASFFDTPAEN